MKTRFLETFIWAARLSSFSAAAERLHTTQASVSNRIAALERELGVTLFTRDVRCVNLTQAGRLALEHAEKIVSLTGEFRQTVSRREALRGTIRLGAADTIVYAWLPLLIRCRAQIRRLCAQPSGPVRFLRRHVYAPTNSAVKLAPDVANRTVIGAMDKVIPVDWIALSTVRDRITQDWRRKVIPLSR